MLTKIFKKYLSDSAKHEFNSQNLFESQFNTEISEFSMSVVEAYTKCCNEKLYSINPITTFNAKRATFNFLFCGLYRQITGKYAKILHFIADSSYFIAKDGKVLDQALADQIKAKLDELIASDNKIELVEMDSIQLCNIFEEQGREEKAYYTSKIDEEKILCAKFGDMLDIVYEPMVLNFNELGLYKIHVFDKGLLLQLPTAKDPTVFAKNRLAELQQQLLVHSSNQWKNFNVESVAQISQYCRTTPFAQIQGITDKLAAEQLDKIEAYILSQFPNKRVVGIAGPSSSGKTTLSIPLKDRLNKKGYDCIIIAIDDYYHHRPEMYHLPDGTIDFEDIRSIQAPLLAERIKKLLAGEEIPVRRFDFITGFGKDSETEKLKLSQNGFVIIEGIHGINPQLFDLIQPLVPIRVYVSPMTPICYDDEHPVSGRDICMMRRVIRDNRERGYSPRFTIGIWPDVCDGEERNINTYVGQVEYFFNSSFVYELPIIAEAGKEIFEKALEPEEKEDKNSKKTAFVNCEVRRIHRLLQMSGHMYMKAIRRGSGMDEFVGEKFVEDAKA